MTHEAMGKLFELDRKSADTFCLLTERIHAFEILKAVSKKVLA